MSVRGTIFDVVVFFLNVVMFFVLANAAALLIMWASSLGYVVASRFRGG